MTNLITRVGWESRVAAYDHQIDLTAGPLRDAVNELVDYLLFVDEEPLTAAIRGTSGFAEKFAAQGPADRRGRSLRQLDLERRLLRYPCSYMIYSAAFGALPRRRARGDLRPDVGRALRTRGEPEVRAALRRRSPGGDGDPARDAARSARRVPDVRRALRSAAAREGPAKAGHYRLTRRSRSGALGPGFGREGPAEAGHRDRRRRPWSVVSGGFSRTIHVTAPLTTRSRP